MDGVDEKSIVCAHYASSYLPITENWIYRTLINHKKFRPIFLSRKKANLSLFPFPSIFSLDDFGVIRQYFEIFLFRTFGYFSFFKGICINNHVRILHVHFGYHGVKMLGLKRKLIIPMVCSFYGDDAFANIHTRGGKGKYSLLFKQAEMILVLGPYMKAELIKLGCPENKITIHHLGINVDEIRFKKRALTATGKVRFLLVAGFVQKKGIDIVIKALSSFQNKFDFSLDIIGDGPLKSDIVNEIDSKGLKECIKLHGYQPYSYFIDLAYQCDVFILASRTGDNNQKEGTPMAIVDAMATGMPVVSTLHSDIPEIVKDGEHGYLAEENDVSSLVSCIQKIFDHPELIGTFSLNARHRVEKEFNAKIQTANLEGYYTDLIRKANLPDS